MTGKALKLYHCWLHHIDIIWSSGTPFERLFVLAKCSSVHCTASSEDSLVTANLLRERMSSEAAFFFTFAKC